MGVEALRKTALRSGLNLRGASTHAALVLLLLQNEGQRQEKEAAAAQKRARFDDAARCRQQETAAGARRAKGGKPDAPRSGRGRSQSSGGFDRWPRRGGRSIDAKPSGLLAGIWPFCLPPQQRRAGAPAT
jgi:hypothetical protein